MWLQGVKVSLQGTKQGVRVPCSLKAFFVEGGPVSNTSVEEADVDVVEVVRRIDPFAAAVVNHKAQVLGRRRFLEGWREIGS